MKKPLTLLLTLFLVASVLPLQVLASGYGVPVSYAGQVIDTMTFNGIRVEAVYAPYYTVSDYDGDSTYSCAALVKRFYKQVYGINVYNLLKVNSTPHISNGSGEFYAVDTPRPGDIIRNNASVHWAIVKDVHGTSVDVFQQNAWYDRAKTQAWVGAVFSTTDKTYTFFRYSGANDASPTWTTVETDKREYLPNETVTFTMNSGGGTLGNTYYRLVVQGDNGFYKTYETGKSVMTLTFDKSQCDNYTAYVIAFNSGGEVKSLNILFSVEAPPTWAKVSTTKTIFEPNEEVTLKLESGGGTPLHTYYTIYIDSSNGFSKTIETGKAFSTLLFDENQCGTYTVYIVAYNYAGAIISSPISFDVAKGCGGNHTWNSGKTTKQPTETAEGVRTYTCTVCGETKTETIPALGHDYQVVVTAPTCTEKGYTTHTCTRCGNSYVDSYVNALGHKTELRNAAAASCTADGYTGDKVCRVCGEVVEKGTVIPAAGHSWDSGEVTKQPTETAEGVKTFTCTVCGETRTEAIPKLEPKPIDPPTPPTPGNPFKDVASGEYFYDPVLWAVNHTPQITKGTSDTTFSPDATCTRGQVVTFLWRAMGEPEPTSAVNKFTDVATSDYFYKAVLWAVEKGITLGTSDTTFSPNDPCTRAHVVTFLWRAEGRPQASGTNPFADVASGQYYYSAVLWAVSKNITQGTSANTFSPDNPCTRAQIVTFLYRDMK